MNDFSWQDFALNPLTAFGLLLVLGVIGGQITTRATKFPAITGYVLIGLIIGPAGLNVVDNAMLHEAGMFTQLALGLALFDIGQRVDMHWLNVEKTLLLTTTLLSLLTLALLSGLLYLYGFTPQASLLMGTLGMATSPMVILEIVRTTKSEGQVTERLVHATALSSLLSMIAFALVLFYVHLSHSVDIDASVVTPAWMILGSLCLGLIAGFLAIKIKQWISAHQAQAQRVLIFGSIALVAGLAEMMHMLPSMALLTLGLATRNIGGGNALIDRGLIPAIPFFFVVFFVASGAQLNPLGHGTYWGVAVAFLAARMLITTGTWWTFARLNGLTRKRATLLGLALSPLPDNTAPLLGLGLLSLGSTMPVFLHTMMPLYAISTLAGPIITRLALVQAGETR